MFICLACAEINQMIAISRSYGPCEFCEQVNICYDIPASAMGTHTLPLETYVTGVGQVLANVHRKDQCKGPWCVIHNPVPGPWDTWPTQWRGDQTVRIGEFDIPVDIWRGFERNCPHGVGHTAVEEVLRGNGHPHGCDGCPCAPRYIEVKG